MLQEERHRSGVPWASRKAPPRAVFTARVITPIAAAD
jgi:hypothetical protein